jgi:hypothetical protein
MKKISTAAVKRNRNISEQAACKGLCSVVFSALKPAPAAIVTPVLYN